ncbi:MAG: hypothetical protein U0869_21920 [Chloroflexota bacterium]
MTTKVLDGARLWRFPNGDWGGDEFSPDPGEGARLVDVLAGVSASEVVGMREELAELRGADDRVLDLERDVFEAEQECDELRALLGEALAFVTDEDLSGRIGRAGVSRGE